LTSSIDTKRLAYFCSGARPTLRGFLSLNVIYGPLNNNNNNKKKKKKTAYKAP